MISSAKLLLSAVKLLPIGISSEFRAFVVTKVSSRVLDKFYRTGDAVGVTVPEQYAKIDELIALHPNTILSLQHETIGS